MIKEKKAERKIDGRNEGQRERREGKRKPIVGALDESRI